MNLKMKVKSYSFWVSLASALILILKLVGQKFGFDVDEGLISDLFTSLCAILVIMGIIVVPSNIVDDKISQENVNQLKEKIKKDIDVKKNEIIENNEYFANDNCDAKVEIISVENELDKTHMSEECEIDNKSNFEKGLEINTAQIDNNETLNAVEEITFTESVEPCVSVEIGNDVENKEVVADREFVSVEKFDLENFIGRVCSRRAELDGNIYEFSKFLQNELENIKNHEN